MNPTYILVALGGGILIVGGLAVGKSLVPAEQTAADRLLDKTKQTAGQPSNPSTTPVPTFTNNVTHTTDPELEKRKATYGQLLSAYQQDLRVAQGEVDNANVRKGNIERAIDPAAAAYATSPKWGYRCNGFPVCGSSEWWEIEGTQQDQSAYNLARNYVTLGTQIPGSRNLEIKGGGVGSHNIPKWNSINQTISSGYVQLVALANDYAAQNQIALNAQARVNDLKKKIADLNAQGVF